MKVKLPCDMYPHGKFTAEICIALSKKSEILTLIVRAKIPA